MLMSNKNSKIVPFYTGWFVTPLNRYENAWGDVFPKIKSVFTNTNFFVVSLNSTFFCLFRIEANRHFAVIRFNFFVLSCFMINQKNLEINTPNLNNKKVFKINNDYKDLYKVLRIQWSTGGCVLRKIESWAILVIFSWTIYLHLLHSSQKKRSFFF